MSLIRVTSSEIGSFDPGQQSVQADAKLFFRAYSDANGTELWISDGTTDGTRMLEGLAGTTGTSPSSLTPVGGTLYFVGWNQAAGYNSIWRYTSGDGPELISGQTFRNPTWLTAAGGNLVFAAQVSGASSDREVYKFDGSMFTKLTNIASDGTNPTELAWFDGRLVFAAQDAPNGSTTETGRVGRELWQVNIEAPYNPSVLANIGQPDQNPTTTSVLQIVGYQLIGGMLVPIYDWVTITIPGNVRGSSPYYLTPADGGLYFSADDGSSGRELWQSDGSATGAWPTWRRAAPVLTRPTLRR